MPPVSPIKDVAEIGERKFKLDSKGVRTYERNFRVQTQDGIDSLGNVIPAKKIGGMEVYFATGMPAIWTPYQLIHNGVMREYDDGALLQDVEPIQTADADIWTIRLFWSSALDAIRRNEDGPFKFGPKAGAGGTGPQAGNAKEANPTLAAPELSWDTVLYSVYRLYDLSHDATLPIGRPRAFLNSAGQPFTEPIEIMLPMLVLKYTRNVVDFDPLLALDYTNSVNTKKFGKFGKYQVLIAKWTGTAQFAKNINYWRESFEFHIRRADDPWHPRKVLDAGYYEVVATKLKAIVDTSTGQPVSTPALLNGAGVKLSQPIDPIVDPKYIEFQDHELRDFAALNIY